MPITLEMHLRDLSNRSRLIILSNDPLNEHECREDLNVFAAIKNVSMTEDLRTAFIEFECEHGPLLVARCQEFVGVDDQIPIPRGIRALLPGCSYGNFYYLQHVPKSLKSEDIMAHFTRNGDRVVKIYRPGTRADPSSIVLIEFAGTPRHPCLERPSQSLSFVSVNTGAFAPKQFYMIPPIPSLFISSSIFDCDGCDNCSVKPIREIFVNAEEERRLEEEENALVARRMALLTNILPVRSDEEEESVESTAPVPPADVETNDSVVAAPAPRPLLSLAVPPVPLMSMPTSPVPLLSVATSPSPLMSPSLEGFHPVDPSPTNRDTAPPVHSASTMEVYKRNGRAPEQNELSSAIGPFLDPSPVNPRITPAEIVSTNVQRNSFSDPGGLTGLDVQDKEQTRDAATPNHEHNRQGANQRGANTEEFHASLTSSVATSKDKEEKKKRIGFSWPRREGIRNERKVEKKKEHAPAVAGCNPSSRLRMPFLENKEEEETENKEYEEESASKQDEEKVEEEKVEEAIPPTDDFSAIDPEMLRRQRLEELDSDDLLSDEEEEEWRRKGYGVRAPNTMYVEKVVEVKKEEENEKDDVELGMNPITVSSSGVQQLDSDDLLSEEEREEERKRSMHTDSSLEISETTVISDEEPVALPSVSEQCYEVNEVVVEESGLETEETKHEDSLSRGSNHSFPSCVEAEVDSVDLPLQEEDIKKEDEVANSTAPDATTSLVESPTLQTQPFIDNEEELDSDDVALEDEKEMRNRDSQVSSSTPIHTLPFSITQEEQSAHNNESTGYYSTDFNTNTPIVIDEPKSPYLVYDWEGCLSSTEDEMDSDDLMSGEEDTTTTRGHYMFSSSVPCESIRAFETEEEEEVWNDGEGYDVAAGEGIVPQIEETSERVREMVDRMVEASMNKQSISISFREEPDSDDIFDYDDDESINSEDTVVEENEEEEQPNIGLAVGGMEGEPMDEDDEEFERRYCRLSTIAEESEEDDALVSVTAVSRWGFSEGEEEEDNDEVFAPSTPIVLDRNCGGERETSSGMSEYNEWLTREENGHRDSNRMDVSWDGETEIVPLPSSLNQSAWGVGISISDTVSTKEATVPNGEMKNKEDVKKSPKGFNRRRPVFN